MQQENENPRTFSDRLSESLKAKGWRAVDLARAIGTSHVTVGNWLKGTIPTGNKLPQLENALGVSAVWLITGSGDKTGDAFRDYLAELKSDADMATELGDTPAERQLIMDLIGERRRADKAEKSLTKIKEKLQEILSELSRF